MQWGDIDWNGKFLMVRRGYVLGRTLPTKTDKDRRVDLSDALLEALRVHRRAMREKWLKKGWSEIPKWVFANQEGKPANMDNVKLRHFYPESGQGRSAPSQVPRFEAHVRQPAASERGAIGLHQRTTRPLQYNDDRRCLRASGTGAEPAGCKQAADDQGRSCRRPREGPVTSRSP